MGSATAWEGIERTRRPITALAMMGAVPKVEARREEPHPHPFEKVPFPDLVGAG
jgi:hypothetical protein